MVVKVVGKQHLRGISKKTGNAYDSTVLYVTHKEDGIEGERAGDIWLDTENYPLNDFDVGGEYEVQYNNRGRVCGIEYVS